jgi:hypothetical protein
MEGVTRVFLFSLLVFAFIFDLLIIGAILHGNSNISLAPVQGPAQVQSQPLETGYLMDKILPTSLPELPLINTN